MGSEKNRYLTIVRDETLAEHDAKYHPNGYRQGDDCKKRDGMAAEDPADTDISKGEKVVSSEEKDGCVEKAKKNAELAERWRKWLRGVSTEKLAETLHKYDDGKHESLIGIIMEEVERREGPGLEKAMNDLGERA